MTNEISEPAWSGYEQDIPVAQGSVQPAHNGSVAGSNPAGDTKYKRVNLDEYISLRPCSEGDEAINGAIREIKSKYGELYAVVEK